MAITRLSGQDSTGTGTTSATTTYGSTPTSGNLMIAVLFVDDNNGVMTYPSGFTKVVEELSQSSAQRTVTVLYKAAGASESSSFSGGSSTAASTQLDLYEYSGFVAPVVDQSSHNASALSTSISTSVPASLNNPEKLAIAVLALGTGSSPVWTGGFNVRHNTAAVTIVDQIVSSTASITAAVSWTTSASPALVLATFQSYTPPPVSRALYLVQGFR
jgi:hypothetical protein